MILFGDQLLDKIVTNVKSVGLVEFPGSGAVTTGPAVGVASGLHSLALSDGIIVFEPIDDGCTGEGVEC